MAYIRKTLPKKVALPPPEIALVSQAVVPRNGSAHITPSYVLKLEDKL